MATLSIPCLWPKKEIKKSVQPLGSYVTTDINTNTQTRTYDTPRRGLKIWDESYYNLFYSRDPLQTPFICAVLWKRITAP